MACMPEAVGGLPCMRITIVSLSIDNSGGFRVVTALGQRLLSGGHDVRIIAPTRRRPDLRATLRAWWRRQQLWSIHHHSDHLGSLADRTTIVPHGAPLTASDLPDADLIIATWWDTMNWLRDMPASKGIPVHLVQDYEVWDGADEEVDRVLRTPGPKIAISSFLHGLLTEQFGQRDVLLLPNAVDHTLFHAAPRSKNTAMKVGFVYSHDPRKGTDLVIKALERVREMLPDLQVIAFGHHQPNVSLPLPAWVDYTIAPEQQTLRHLYASCDAWLFGSRREGFGLPILEAMACRTPVIGLNAGAAADLLGNGCGILLENGDWVGMADAILRVAAMHDTEWRALSDRAHDRAKQQNWNDVGATLEQWLESVVARPQAPLTSTAPAEPSCGLRRSGSSGN
jgi:glycosyltransferase involved in cell wall biosynthesis